MNSNLRRGLLAAIKAGVVALLPPHPDDPSQPAFFQESGQQHPVFPCLTYRISTDTPDSRFAPTMAEGGGSSPMTQARIELRCYGKDETGGGSTAKRDALSAAVRAVLDGKALPFTGGRIFRASLITELPDQPDPANRAKYHLLRFALLIHFS